MAFFIKLYLVLPETKYVLVMDTNVVAYEVQP